MSSSFVALAMAGERTVLVPENRPPAVPAFAMWLLVLKVADGPASPAAPPRAIGIRSPTGTTVLSYPSNMPKFCHGHKSLPPENMPPADTLLPLTRSRRNQ
jgi:hypothetical protein